MRTIRMTILVLLVVLAAISVWVDYSLWRLQHPEAPTWTYLFAE